MSHFIYPHRRAFVAGVTALAVSGGAAAQGKGRRISALFAGRVDDGGFMQAGYDGLKLAESRLGAAVAFTQGIQPQPEALMEALRGLALAKPDLVIAHGGQNNAAAAKVAVEFPDLAFAVTQGNVIGANVASYEVLQEHSAFLGGMLAGLMTKSGVVGHMSGIRVTPGLKGRAAYASGVLHANPQARLLTNFSGNQDDNALSKRVATAIIDAGADIIFTMLNAGRMGAVEACRERSVQQIGNVRDWTTVVPDVFIASACADAGLALFSACDDMIAGRFKAGVIKQIGLEQPEAVRLTMAPRVPEPVRARIAAAAADIVSGKLKVSTEFSGAEFATPG